MVFDAHSGGSEIQASPEFQWPVFVCLFWLLSAVGIPSPSCTVVPDDTHSVENRESKGLGPLLSPAV